MHLLKWVRFGEMGYTSTDGFRFEKWFTLEKLVRLNKIDDIWRNVCSCLKGLSHGILSYFENRQNYR